MTWEWVSEWWREIAHERNAWPNISAKQPFIWPAKSAHTIFIYFIRSLPACCFEIPSSVPNPIPHVGRCLNWWSIWRNSSKNSIDNLVLAPASCQGWMRYIWKFRSSGVAISTPFPYSFFYFSCRNNLEDIFLQRCQLRTCKLWVSCSSFGEDPLDLLVKGESIEYLCKACVACPDLAIFSATKIRSSKKHLLKAVSCDPIITENPHQIQNFDHLEIRVQSSRDEDNSPAIL